MRLGCNYWASNAGTEMWVNWKPDVVRNDLRILHQHGITYLRVFPNWRDFQPVEGLYECCGDFREYRLTGDRIPTNEFFLDEQMLDRFDQFCDICQEYGMKLIVGLLTGWMSGRLFIPPALQGKNLCTDITSLYFEQKFIAGFVKRFKDREVIWAWDHGNEIGCLGYPNDAIASDAWVQMLSNAVYAQDRSRPLISGVHNLELKGVWNIAGQSSCCDMLVSHPYPYWSRIGKNDTINYIRTTLYPSALTKLFADIGNKPCLIEEIGSMGPAVCSEERAAELLNVTFFSDLANGGEGVLWWCAHDQSHLMTPPYTWAMPENELGMMDISGQPKPVLKRMKALDKFAKGMKLPLPKAHEDAVCLLTSDQDHLGVGCMAFMLAKQAHMNIAFADAAKPLPDAKVYMLPSVAGTSVMPKEQYYGLLDRVHKGATLYISYDGACLIGFEALTGNRIIDTETCPYCDEIELNGHRIPYHTKSRLLIEQVNAQPIQTPQITKHRYGKGTVYYVNFPVEAMLIEGRRTLDAPACEIYKEIFKEQIAQHPVKCSNKNVAITFHHQGEYLFVVAVNHSDQVQHLHLETDLLFKKIHYGEIEACKPMDAVVVEYAIK